MNRPNLVQIKLTKEEAKLLDLFRKMDMRARHETLRMSEWKAETYPMTKRPAAPSVPRGVRLAASFGKVVTA